MCDFLWFILFVVACWTLNRGIVGVAADMGSAVRAFRENAKRS